MQPGLIIVSNRLPVSVKKVDGKLEFSRSVGGLATGLASYTTDGRNKWIGWPGLPSDNLTDKDRKEIADEFRKSNCYPVFLTQKQIEGFYNGYSNRLIWPLLHDIAPTASALKLEETYWRVFRQVSKLYADTVLAMSDPENNIWVHDYQLMLVPALLRAERLDGRFGFFLHTPWPAPKAFKPLKHGTELVRGILGADLVGLQIRRYTNNFMATVRQMKLSPAGGPHLLRFEGRVVRVTDFPIGIDYAQWQRAGRLSEVRRESKRLRKQYRGKKLIVTLERLDLSKGLVERVEAYQELLRENPKLHGKVQMVMIATPTRTEVKEYQELKKRLEKLVGEVNKEFGTKNWEPIDYQYVTLPFEHVFALFRRANIGFITPFRDGMNLVAKEYVASKQHGRKGVLILSTTAGAAQELTDAVMVDPTSRKSQVLGLQEALKMPRTEARQRITAMQHNLSSSTIHTWARGFMDNLQRGTGLPNAATFTLTGTKQRALVNEYAKALKPLLLLDYDGVLAPIVGRPEDAKPSRRLVNILKRLGEQTNVVVISGRDRNTMHDWLGDLPVALVAEHGNFTKSATGKTWGTTPNTSLPNWQKAIKPVLEKYADKTPGAFVETKSAALVWHYRKANPYYAQKNLVTLKRILKPLVGRFGLEARQGKKVLEIRPEGLNKGTSSVAWLEKIKPDFVLCLGDDYTDEDMFKALPDDAYTIKVGRGRTMAKYRLKNVEAVHNLLDKLSKA